MKRISSTTTSLLLALLLGLSGLADAQTTTIRGAIKGSSTADPVTTTPIDANNTALDVYVTGGIASPDGIIRDGSGAGQADVVNAAPTGSEYGLVTRQYGLPEPFTSSDFVAAQTATFMHGGMMGWDSGSNSWYRLPIMTAIANRYLQVATMGVVRNNSFLNVETNFPVLAGCLADNATTAYHPITGGAAAFNWCTQWGSVTVNPRDTTGALIFPDANSTWNVSPPIASWIYTGLHAYNQGTFGYERLFESNGYLGVHLRDSSGNEVGLPTSPSYHAIVDSSGTTNVAYVRDFGGTNDALNVSIADASGNQIGISSNPLYVSTIPSRTDSVDFLSFLNDAQQFSAQGDLTFVITGTWSGTITFQVLSGSTYVTSPIGCIRLSDNAIVTTTTANGTFRCGGFTHAMQVQMTAYTSGSATVAVQTNETTNFVHAFTPMKLWDGTDTASVTAAGRLEVDGSGVTQPISGTVTANAGTNLNTSALALSATQTDGTQKSIIRGGAKGATTAADVTSTASGANHQPVDVAIYDAAGNQITSFGGGTEYTEDVAAAADPVGKAPILVRADTPAAITSTDGDNVAQRGTNYGAAYVTLLDTGGSPVSVGGGTQYDQGTATTSTDKLTMAGAVRRDTAAVDAGVADGDRLTLSTDSAGRLRVTAADTTQPVSGTVTVTDGAGALNVIVDSGSITANAGTNLNTSLLSLETTQVDVRTSVQLLDDAVATTAAAIPSKGIAASGTDGTNARILKTDTNGELQIDVLTLPAITGTVTANQGGAPWSQNTTQLGGNAIDLGNGTVGTGTQRVTLASDSTGQVAVASLPNEGQQTMANSISVAVASDQSSIPVTEQSSSAIVAGQQSVTASAVALPSNTAKEVCIKSLIGNALNIYVGPSGVTTTTGLELAPGDGWCTRVTNSNALFVVASGTGSSVSYAVRN